MSIINLNITNDTTKNDLYNSYITIKKQKFFNENIKDDLFKDKISKNKNSFENEVNNINNDSNKYCQTASKIFQKKKKIIPILNYSINSFNLNSSSNKCNKNEIQKITSSQIMTIKQKILNARENSLSKNTNINFFKHFIKKNKIKNYFKEDIKKKNLYKNLTTINGDKFINLNKTKLKLKELKFRVFHSIQKNYIPLCSHFISNAESINRKILDYYSGENYKNLLKIYKKNFHNKRNLETNPKIDKYVNIKKINNESSFTKKLNLDKLFNEEEKKIILLEPDYFFKNTNKDCFENVNITKTNKLVDKLNKEELINEELIEKKKIKCNTENNLNKYNIKRTNILNKIEVKLKDFEEDYFKEYKNNKMSIEKLIKKENKSDKKKVINLEEVFEKEIKNSYKKYKNLIYRPKKINLNKKFIFLNTNSSLDMKKNLIENNYKHIKKNDELINNIKKIYEKGNNRDILYKYYKRNNNYELKNLTNNKQTEYVKIILNKIKNNYSEN